jgi:DivIVA domain-containing protein
MNTLRNRMDADARFHRVVRGYDPEEVQVYLEELRSVFNQQAKAGKREQEALIASLNAAKSEIDARNCVVKSLTDKVAQREMELSEAAKRITTLVQYVKKYEAEREGVLRLKSSIEQMRTETQRAKKLDVEIRQLRETLGRATAASAGWKQEQEALAVENEKMQSELIRLRSENARLIAERDEARSFAYMAAKESREESGRREHEDRCNGTSRENPPVIPSQTAGRLADIFAEAYEIVNRLSGEPEGKTDPPQRNTPRMQVLRPDGSTGERGSGTRKKGFE